MEKRLRLEILIKLNFSPLLDKLKGEFPNDQPDVAAFFSANLQAQKHETKGPSKSAMPVFKTFNEFLDYYKDNTDASPIVYAKKLRNLFIAKASLEISRERKQTLKGVTSILVKEMLKEDVGAGCEFFNAILASKLYDPRELASFALDAIDLVLISPEKYLNALELCSKFLGVQGMGSKVYFGILNKLLSFQLDSKQKMLYQRALDLISRVRWEPENLLEQVAGWTSLLEILFSESQMTFLLPIFCKHWGKFVLGQSKVHESIKHACKQFSVAILKAIEKDEPYLLLWAHEIEQSTDSSALAKLKQDCTALLREHITKGCQSIVPFYLKAEGFLSQPKQREMFLGSFATFLRFCTGKPEEIMAIQRGVQYLIQHFSITEASTVLKILSSTADSNKLPPPLLSSLAALRVHSGEQPKKAEQPVVSLLAKLLDQFRKTQASEESLINFCIETLRKSIQTKGPDVKLTCQDGLIFLEEAICCGKPRAEAITHQKSLDNPLRKKLLKNLLEDLQKYTEWSSKESERLTACQKDIEFICTPDPKPKPAAASATSENFLFPELNCATREAVAKLSTSQCHALLVKYERMAKSQPISIALGCTMLNLYLRIADGKKVCLWGFWLLRLPLLTPKDSRLVKQYIGRGLTLLGEMESALRYLNEVESLGAASKKEDKIYEQTCLATAYLYDLQSDKALKILMNLKQTYPNDFINDKEFDRLVELATMCQQGELSKVLNQIEDTPVPPNLLCELYFLGSLCQRIGAEDKAILYFEKFNARQPEDFNVTEKLVKLYMNAGNYQKAISCLKIATVQPFYESNFYWIHSTMGRVYYLSNKWHDSIMHFSKNMSQQIVDVTENGGRQHFLMAIQKFIECMQGDMLWADFYRQVIEVHKVLREIANIKIVSKEHGALQQPFVDLLSQFEKMEYKALEKVIAKLQSSSQSKADSEIFKAGLSLLEMNLSKDIVSVHVPVLLETLQKYEHWSSMDKHRLTVCSRSMSTDKAEGEHGELLGFISEVENKPPEYCHKLISHYEKILENNPESPLETRIKLLCSYDKINNTEKLLECASKIKEDGRDLQKSLILIYVGRAYLLRGYNDNAKRNLDLALDNMPTDLRIQHMVFESYIYTGYIFRGEEPLADLQKAKHPVLENDDFKYAIQLRTLLCENRHKDAIQAILSRPSNSPKELHLLTMLYMQLKDLPNQIETVKKIIEAIPEVPILFRTLGDLYYKFGKMDLALEYFTKVTNVRCPMLEDFDTYPRALSAKGKILFRMKQWHDVIQNFTTALTQTNSDWGGEKALDNIYFLLAFVKYAIEIKNNPSKIDAFKIELLKNDLSKALAFIQINTSIKKDPSGTTTGVIKIFSHLSEMLSMAVRVYLTGDVKREQKAFEEHLFQKLMETEKLCARHEVHQLRLDFLSEAQLLAKGAQKALIGKQIDQYQLELLRQVPLVNEKKATVEGSDAAYAAVLSMIEHNIDTLKTMPERELTNMKALLKSCKDSGALPAHLRTRADAILRMNSAKKNTNRKTKAKRRGKSHV